MNCAGFRDLRSAPRNRPVERIVELEHSRSVAPAFEVSAIPARQDVVADPDELPRRHIAEDEFAPWELAKRRHLAARLDLAAERAEASGQRVCDRL
jgi:hypothetical protein